MSNSVHAGAATTASPDDEIHEIARIPTRREGGRDKVRVELVPVGPHGSRLTAIVQYRPDRFGGQGMGAVSKIMLNRVMIDEVIEALHEAKAFLHRRKADGAHGRFEHRGGRPKSISGGNTSSATVADLGEPPEDRRSRRRQDDEASVAQDAGLRARLRAEAELLAIVRGEIGCDVVLKVELVGGRCLVETVEWADRDRVQRIGSGSTFTDAWRANIFFSLSSFAHISA